MAERVQASPSSYKFPGLIISNLVFTDVKLGRGDEVTVYAVEWNRTVCAAKRGERRGGEGREGEGRSEQMHAIVTIL